VAKRKRKSTKVQVEHHPSWDKRFYSSKKRGSLSLTHSALSDLGETDIESLIQGIRGLSFILEDIAASAGVESEDDERDLLYTAERIRIYIAALVTKIPDQKRVGRKYKKGKKGAGN